MPHLDPTPEQLALLTPAERRCYRFADAFNRRFKALSSWWIGSAMCGVLWFTAGNRLRIHGDAHLASLDDPNLSVIFVANHRSFFDFYAITYAAITRTRLTRRTFFPVRSGFFYEGVLGTAVNLACTGMAMFPPIFREREKAPFNRYALKRLNAELQASPTLVGIHPEGRRNHDPDPYSLLRGRKGVGQLALACPGVRVVPIFVKGMTSDLLSETWKNWFTPDDHPIDITYGADVPVADLAPHADDPDAWTEVARRCMRAIGELASDQRARDHAAERLGENAPAHEALAGK